MKTTELKPVRLTTQFELTQDDLDRLGDLQQAFEDKMRADLQAVINHNIEELNHGY